MKLYFSTGSCSLAPRIVLEELQISYSDEKVNLKTKKTASGDFPNPKGTVPALLLDNGELLTEVAVILQYLADLKGELLPKAGDFRRYRGLEWLNYIGTEIHKRIGFISDLEGVTKDIPTVKASLDEKLARRFDFVGQQLKATPFLMGAEFSVADSYLFTTLRWPHLIGFDMSAWPDLLEYFARVKALPGVARALEREGLSG